MRFFFIAIRDPKRRRRVERAFTLIETVLVVAIMAALFSWSAYAWVRQATRTRGKTCGQYLNMIEDWKARWRQEFPGVDIPADVNDAGGLRRYAVGGVMPTCPGGGTYQNVTTAGTVCTCSLNYTFGSALVVKVDAENPGAAAARAADPDEGGDRGKNGYHDVGY